MANNPLLRVEWIQKIGNCRYLIFVLDKQTPEGKEWIQSEAAFAFFDYSREIYVKKCIDIFCKIGYYVNYELLYKLFSLKPVYLTYVEALSSTQIMFEHFIMELSLKEIYCITDTIFVNSCTYNSSFVDMWLTHSNTTNKLLWDLSDYGSPRREWLQNYAKIRSKLHAELLTAIARQYTTIFIP